MKPGDTSTSAWVAGAMARYEGPLTRYARRFTGDIETARDVVQDTFLRLCSCERSSVEDHLAPWLYRVCRNRALDVMKKENRMQPLSEGQAEAQPSTAPPPGVLAQGQETEAQVLAAVAALPPEQQEVFRLKFLDELSYKEIAEVTGADFNRVRYLIHTALKQLRIQLRDRLEPAAEA